MTRAEEMAWIDAINLEDMRAGRSADFSFGRIIWDTTQDLTAIKRMCIKYWDRDFNEVYQGMQFQKAVQAAVIYQRKG